MHIMRALFFREIGAVIKNHLIRTLRMPLEPYVDLPAAAVLIAEFGRIFAHVILPGNHTQDEFVGLVNDEPLGKPRVLQPYP